jgi:hypothetical protein
MRAGYLRITVGTLILVVNCLTTEAEAQSGRLCRALRLQYMADVGARSERQTAARQQAAEWRAGMTEAEAAEAMEAQLRMNAAKSQLLQAGRNHAEVRKEAAGRIAESLRIEDAVQEMKQAEALLKQAKLPVLEALRATTEYQDLVRKADAESKERLTQKAENPGRQTVLSSGAMLELSFLEHSALADSKDVAAAREACERAQLRVRELRQKVKDLVEKDAAVHSAASEVESARRHTRS